MNKIIPTSYLILILSGIMVGSCKKLVEIDPPVTQLASTSVFSKSTTATSALFNIYQQMVSLNGLPPIELNLGLVADEFENYTSGNFDAYQNALISIGLDRGYWGNVYPYIFQANAILENLKDNAAIAPKISQQLQGEAKFIRAFSHLYLVSVYGDIPVVTTTDYTINRFLPRSPKDKVYDQVIADLKDAQSLLNSDYVDASDTVITTERVRPTKWGATALLARAYLYKGDFQNAEIEATAVISNNTTFELLTDLDKVFLANSREAIWQLATPLNGGTNGGTNTQEAAQFVLYKQPTNVSLSLLLLNAFEPGDKRKTSWVGSITTGIPLTTYYFPYKYKVIGDPTPATTEEYTTVIRLAEMYLIRAEARVKQNKIAEGIADLNILRQRARASATVAVPDPLPDLPATLSQPAALDAVLHERQIELFTEGGHRWFDMIRMGYINTIMGPPGDVTQKKGGLWKQESQLFPIPQTELTANPNLIQNPGY